MVIGEKGLKCYWGMFKGLFKKHYLNITRLRESIVATFDQKWRSVGESRVSISVECTGKL